MKAFVICGGLGTRLRPYTYETPKPMLPIGGKPILRYVVENLRENGITDIVMAVGYLNEKIRAYFGNGSRFGVKIGYAVETEPKNTAGSILDYAERMAKAKEPFIVIMGDAISGIDLRKMARFHGKSRATATIALMKHKTKVHYGIAVLKKDRITAFREKPEIEHYINTGIYIFEPKVFGFIKEREDFAKNVFPRLLSKRQKISGFRVESGSWIDIGRIEEYDKLKDGAEVRKMLGK